MKFLGTVPMALFVATSWLATAGTPFIMGSAGESSVADESSATSSRQHVVTIKDFVFEPATLQVAVGDTVVFVNEDLVPHTTTADDRSWDSGLMKSEDVWSLRIDADTAESYFCLYHPSMKAALQIAAP